MSVELRAISLCSGIGGLDLGLHPAGLVSVCYVERDSYAAAVLVARMGDETLDQAPVWSDIATFDGEPWRGVVDLVVAGAPCQPFSTASRGRKVAVDLLPDVLRIIRECQPWLVFVENVLGAGERLEQFRVELQAAGYDSPPLAEVSSAAVGAPHDRERLWLLAYAHGQGERLRALHAEVASLRPAPVSDWASGVTAHSVLGMADGSADRMDRLRCLGNAVVPSQAFAAFRELVRRACEG